MNVVVYTLMAYGITALLSLAVVAIIVVIGKTVGKSGKEKADD